MHSTKMSFFHFPVTKVRQTENSPVRPWNAHVLVPPACYDEGNVEAEHEGQRNEVYEPLAVQGQLLECSAQQPRTINSRERQTLTKHARIQSVETHEPKQNKASPPLVLIEKIPVYETKRYVEAAEDGHFLVHEFVDATLPVEEELGECTKPRVGNVSGVRDRHVSEPP